MMESIKATFLLPLFSSLSLCLSLSSFFFIKIAELAWDAGEQNLAIPRKGVVHSLPAFDDFTAPLNLKIMEQQTEH